jgi:hypothetical protein
MTEGDRSKALAELLATPLDGYVVDETPEERRQRRPAPWGMVLALVVGAAIVLAGYRIANDSGDEEATAVTTPPPTTAAATAAASGATFPAGFTKIDDSLAVKVVRVAPSGEDLAVTMASVIARGLDADASTPFTGGRWVAVLSDGTTAAARGQLVDPATPGVVTALFDPAEVTEANLVSLRLTERWFNQSVGTVQDLDVSGDLPWTMPERTLLDLGDGVQLVVDSMELTETGGIVEWSLTGGTTLGVVALEVALEEGFFDGRPRMMIPIGRIDRFFFDPATAVPEGRIELSGPTEAGGEGIANGFAIWSVRLTTATPADALIPVATAGG